MPRLSVHTKLHRCPRGHPLNPTSLADWQEGFGFPASECYRHKRTCAVCREPIPASWQRLACGKGCDHSVCCRPACAARALEAAKNEVAASPSVEAALRLALQTRSLLLREAALEAIASIALEGVELGQAFGAGAEAPPEVAAATAAAVAACVGALRHDGLPEARKGTSACRADIKSTYADVTDGTAHALEYAGWRDVRVKGAAGLAALGAAAVLTEATADARPEVREAACVGAAALARPGRQQEVPQDLVEALADLLDDEVEVVRLAAAGALRWLAAAGIPLDRSASTQMAQALRRLDCVTCSVSGAPRRRWRDAEARLIFERRLAEALVDAGREAVEMAWPVLGACTASRDAGVRAAVGRAEALLAELPPPPPPAPIDEEEVPEHMEEDLPPPGEGEESQGEQQVSGEE